MCRFDASLKGATEPVDAIVGDVGGECTRGVAVLRWTMSNGKMEDARVWGEPLFAKPRR